MLIRGLIPKYFGMKVCFVTLNKCGVFRSLSVKDLVNLRKIAGGLK
jgi:hypothetical protein